MKISPSIIDAGRFSGTRCGSVRFFRKSGLPAHAAIWTAMLLLIQVSSGLEVIQVRNVDGLMGVLKNSPSDIRIQLSPAVYTLSPVGMIDSTCGNCEDPHTPVDVTVGLLVTGKNIQIVGPAEGTAEIVTGAGYGIFFLNCYECSISGVSITGGQRDVDGNATDAAVVVKQSSVTITDCTIHDNTGDPATVSEVIVGVMGIAGRERSHVTIENNRIIRNSWDGIALYRGAEAVIRDNVIDGVDKARGSTIGGGRGVGIGVTWDARAVIEGNLVTRYWKGIGLFVDAHATVRENIVENVLTWGITLWDADRGRPHGEI
ncbi:MAG: right-handed parallel beta-helix repeat-containing protein, partial [Fidelibacterota bacterium]